jgi:precorrin-3B synthase
VLGLLLDQIATRHPGARARDFAADGTTAALSAAIAAHLVEGPLPPQRPPAEIVATHLLNDGSVARGFALAFGHTTADSLSRLAGAAADQGARSVRPAPGRALLAIGLSHAAAERLAARAADENFIVDAADPRRQVVACAGAPACDAALLATRQWAPQVAEAASTLLDGSLTIHLSGCSKGCAHPGRAALTVVGPGHVVLGGSAGDAPQASVTLHSLMAGLGRLERQRLHGEPSARMTARIGDSRVLEVLLGEPRND